MAPGNKRQRVCPRRRLGPTKNPVPIPRTVFAPNGRFSNSDFWYAGWTMRSKWYSRYTKSPCATPTDASFAESAWRSVKTSGSFVVNCGQRSYEWDKHQLRSVRIQGSQG